MSYFPYPELRFPTSNHAVCFGENCCGFFELNLHIKKAPNRRFFDGGISKKANSATSLGKTLVLSRTHPDKFVSTSQFDKLTEPVEVILSN